MPVWCKRQKQALPNLSKIGILLESGVGGSEEPELVRNLIPVENPSWPGLPFPKLGREGGGEEGSKEVHL